MIGKERVMKNKLFISVLVATTAFVGCGDKKSGAKDSTVRGAGGRGQQTPAAGAKAIPQSPNQTNNYWSELIVQGSMQGYNANDNARAFLSTDWAANIVGATS